MRKASSWLIPFSLIADAILFFARPLFSNQYIFPWDFRYVQLPLITLLADELKKGRLPLWDPYTYCGNPVFANIQASYFHPLVLAGAWLSAWGSLARILEWVVVLQVCVAGLFTYRLARHIGATQAGAWTSAVMCQTGCYFASRTEHMGVMMAAAWMPAAWYAVIAMRERYSSRMLALLGASLGMAVFGGFPAATVAVFGSVMMLSLILWGTRLGTAMNVLRTALGCAAGIGVSAISFIPAAQLTNNGVAKYRLDWLGTGGGLRWQSLVSLIAPNYYHIFDLKNFKGPWDPSFLYLYCSLAGLALAVWVLLGKRDRWVACFGWFCLLGVLWMLGDSLPGWSYVYPLVPERVRIGIHPEYTYSIFAQSMAMLGGLGVSRLLPRQVLQWTMAAVIALDLYLTGSNRPMNCTAVRDEPGLTEHALYGSEELLEGVRRLSHAEFPPARIDTIGASIYWAECAPMTRVPTGSGASPLAPQRMIQIRLGLHDGGRAGWYYPVEKLDSRMLDIMAEPYLVAGADSAVAVAAHPRFQKVADLPGIAVFRNTTALPRAFAVTGVIESSFEDAVLMLRKPEFDLTHSATVERDEEHPFPAALVRRQDLHATAQFVEYSPDRLVVKTASDRSSLLVLSEAWYPGWEARIDGKPVPIYIADAAFRGVFLPAGEHRIEMEFRPGILKWSLAVSVFSFLVLCGLCFQRRAVL